jgi:hypothetical protein
VKNTQSLSPPHQSNPESPEPPQSQQHDKKKRSTRALFFLRFLFKSETIINNISWFFFSCLCRLVVTVSRPVPMVGPSPVPLTATKRPELTTAAWRWQSTRWLSWWKRIWAQPCSIYKGKGFVWCPSHSQPLSQPPLVTTGAPRSTTTTTLCSNPTAKGQPRPACLFW